MRGSFWHLPKRRRQKSGEISGVALDSAPGSMRRNRATIIKDLKIAVLGDKYEQKLINITEGVFMTESKSCGYGR